MRQDERNSGRDDEAGRDAHRRRFSDEQFDRALGTDRHSSDAAADAGYGESGRMRSEQRQQQQQRSRRDLGHDDGWGDNREGYDNPGRYGVRGSTHEGRGGYTQDRAEEGLGGYSQSWAEFGFQGSGWSGNPRDEPSYRRDDYAPWGGESWPGYQVRQGASGRLDTWSSGSGSEGRHAGRGPRGYRRKDERIMDDVCEALTHHPDIDASEIEVRVESGEVTLTGTVDSREAKRAAEDAAEDCSGVDNVINQLRVARGAQAEDRGRSSQGWRQRMSDASANKDGGRGGNSGSGSSGSGRGGSSGNNNSGNRGGSSGEKRESSSRSGRSGSDSNSGSRSGNNDSSRSGRSDR